MLLQKEYAFPVRHYVKESAPPALKGDREFSCAVVYFLIYILI